MASIVLAADLLGRHIPLFQFGGIAIYPATALALGILPVLFTSQGAGDGSEWLAAALAINSVDHLGAGLAEASMPLLLQIAAMVIVLCLWLAAGLLSAPRRWRPILLVLAYMVLPFIGGILVREATGSYVGVQRSGFIGVGRLIATSLLAYATLPKLVFSSPEPNRTVQL